MRGLPAHSGYPPLTQWAAGEVERLDWLISIEGVADGGNDAGWDNPEIALHKVSTGSVQGRYRGTTPTPLQAKIQQRPIQPLDRSLNRAQFLGHHPGRILRQSATIPIL